MSRKIPESQTQWDHQREDILIAIDQLSQMTEVMNDVLSRVKQQVDVLDNSAKTHPMNNNTVDRRPTKKPTKTNNNQKNKKINLVH